MPEDELNIPDLLETSLRAQREGDTASARAGYLRVLQSAPNHPVALNRLGILDAEEGKLDDAERLIRRAIARKPQEAAYYSNLANVLKKKERYPDAIHAYEYALHLDATLGDVHNNLGALLLDAGHAKEAQVCLQKALEITGETAEIRNNLGRALNNQGQLDEAAGEFRRAIELNPDYAPAHLNLGHVLRAQRRFTYAAASYQSAISINPELHKAYHGLGTVYMAQNIPEDAIECFEKALELEPDDFNALIDLGVLLHSLGRLHQAVAAYRKAIKLNPKSAQAYNNLGVVLLERGNVKAAESALRTAIQIDPGFVDPYAHIAAIFDQQGRVEELHVVVEEGLRINPEQKQLNFQAARLAMHRGETQKAIELLSRFDTAALDDRIGQLYRYELGRAYDRLDDPGMAFLHVSEANRLASVGWRAQSIDLQRIPALIDQLGEFFAEESPGSWPASPPLTESAPVFLLGFPGMGVDFIAEALRHHSRVRIVPNPSGVGAVVRVIDRYEGGYPRCLKDLSEARCEQLRQVYFAQVAKMVDREGGAVLVDNQSINTLHSGLIWRLFPDARVLSVVRHPCDVVLSNFMQNYSLNDTNAHFLTLEGSVALYEKTMRLWRRYTEALPIAIHEVRYEQLSGRLRQEIGGVLAFIGLEPEKALDEHLETISDGAQVSMSSLRLLSNPMEAHTHYRWRAYADQLGPFMDRLAPFIEHYGYDSKSAADKRVN